MALFNYMVILCLLLSETAVLVQQWLHHFTFPPVMHKRSDFSTCSPTFGPSTFYFLIITIPMGVKGSTVTFLLLCFGLGADCGSDHELLIAKFRFKLKKVGKTTRPFRYDLNQILNDYIVEVTNRFKD